jgi:hypothetical protein
VVAKNEIQIKEEEKWKLRQEQVVEETLEVLAERMITKIREFEEYKQLQKDLTEYYKAKQKLN